MNPAELLPPSPDLHVPLINAGSTECRFIVADAPQAICCGAPTVGGTSWCPWHRRIVYVPSADRSRPKAA